ncbi:hypothetical protein L2E82_31815 [Cichorium intybus]|uniref:Uncharacterized protein n=1 Tax=Cichorium intybus TaxID=13427 RepID=A0ACB9BIU1_CICIN|nr:hypothetical protein L2E82_31815 [Cichorium intybus]
MNTNHLSSFIRQKRAPQEQEDSTCKFIHLFPFFYIFLLFAFPQYLPNFLSLICVCVRQAKIGEIFALDRQDFTSSSWIKTGDTLKDSLGRCTN